MSKKQDEQRAALRAQLQGCSPDTYETLKAEMQEKFFQNYCSLTRAKHDQPDPSPKRSPEAGRSDRR